MNIINNMKPTLFSGPSLYRGLCMSALVVGLAACGSSNNNDDMDEPTPTQEFQIDIVNLTASQPFSPIAAVAHSGDYSIFSIGEPASLALENLAEGGDNADLIADADASDDVFDTAAGEAPVGPGGSDSLTLSVDEDMLAGAVLSSVTMLVNTNDAITAISNVSLEGMEVGDTRTLTSISYDSGTEANSELAGTIPGPADGGEGFNVARDDIADQVLMHGGVITLDGGKDDSRLTEVHRWDNPVARYTVTRVQ